MKIKQTILLIILLNLTFLVEAQKKIDSIRVYYMPIDLLNITPINAERVKTFPPTKTFLIQDSVRLVDVMNGIMHLKRATINFAHFDPRVLCVIYRGKKKQNLLINGTKFIYYRRKTFEPSENLFKLIYPK
jgi:hypothetical protein